MKASLVLASLLVTLGIATPAWPAYAAYPERPVTLIVPWGPGNGTDIVARRVARLLETRIGQPVVVHNVAGAGGTIGSTQLHNAAPDGYTIMMASNADHASAPGVFAQLPYDPVRAEPILRVVSIPNVVVTGKSSKIDSISGLVNEARLNPGKLNYAATGKGTSSHLMAEAFNLTNNLEVTSVQYKTTGNALVDMTSGIVQYMFFNIQAAIPQIRSGSLRPLAVSSAQRSAALPEVPTLIESGFKAMPNAWMGLIAPPGTPTAVTRYLAREIAAVLAAPEFRKSIENDGVFLFSDDSPEAFREFIKQEVGTWGGMARMAGVKPE